MFCVEEAEEGACFYSERKRVVGRWYSTDLVQCQKRPISVSKET